MDPTLGITQENQGIEGIGQGKERERKDQEERTLHPSIAQPSPSTLLPLPFHWLNIFCLLDIRSASPPSSLAFHSFLFSSCSNSLFFFFFKIIFSEYMKYWVSLWHFHRYYILSLPVLPSWASLLPSKWSFLLLYATGNPLTLFWLLFFSSTSPSPLITAFPFLCPMYL